MDQEIIDDSFRYEKEKVEVIQKEKVQEDEYVGKEERRRRVSK